MKNTFKKLSFSLTCLLGIGGMVLAGITALSAPKNINVAKADGDYLYIAGCSSNLIENPTAAGSKVTLTASGTTYTLTLNGYTYSGAGYVDANYYNGYVGLSYRSSNDLNIVLVGSNTININQFAEGTNYRTYGAVFRYSSDSGSSFNKVVVKGNGSLALTAYSIPGASACSYGMEFRKTHFYLEESNGTTSPTLIVRAGRGGTNDGNCFTSGISSRYNGYFYINRGTIEAYGGDANCPNEGNSQDTYGIQCDNFIMNGGTATFVGGTANGQTDSTGFSSYGSPTFNGGTFVCQGGAKGSGNTTGKSIGIVGETEWYGPSLYTIANTMTRFTVSGYDNAILENLTIKNAIAGLGWANVAGTGTGSSIPTTTTSQTISTSYKKVRFGGIIDATVTGYNGSYDGQGHSISVSVATPSTGATIKYGTTSGSCTLDVAPTYENVGTYTTYVEITAPNYDKFTGSATITITKANPTYTAPAAKENLTYNLNEQDLITAGSSDHGTFTYKLSTATIYGSDIPTATNPGTYTVDWKLTGDANHNNAEGSIEVTIGKAVISDVSVEVQGEYTFDGDMQTPVITKSATTVGDVPYTFKYSKTQGDYDVELPLFAEAGNHTIYFEITAENHDAYYGSFVFTIASATFSGVTVEVQGEYTFTGEAIAPTINASATTVDAVPYTFKYSKTETGTYGDIPTFDDAGTHTVYYELTAESHETVHGSVTFTIKEAQLVNFQFEVETGSFEYDGEPHTPVVQSSAKAVTGEDVIFEYSLSETGEYGTMPSFTDAGSYVVYWKAEAENHETKSGSFNVVVGKAASILEVVPTAIDNLHYTGETYELVSAGEASGGTLVYKVGEEGMYSEEVPTAVNAGTYDIYYMVEGDANHSDIPAVKITVTIAQNDKANLSQALGLANNLYGTIVKDYSEIAGELKAVIDAAQLVFDNPNVTVEQIKKAYDSLLAAMSDAQVDVAVAKINAIGEVEYTQESKDKIDAAREAYDALSEEQQAEVANYSTLEKAEEKYIELDILAHKGLPGWAIALIVIGSLLLLCCLFFVLVVFKRIRYIEVDGKIVKAVILVREAKECKLLTLNFKRVNKNNNEVFLRKEYAEQFLASK